jgi:hypothetical protein
MGENGSKPVDGTETGTPECEGRGVESDVGAHQSHTGTPASKHTVNGTDATGIGIKKTL